MSFPRGHGVIGLLILFAMEVLAPTAVAQELLGAKAALQQVRDRSQAAAPDTESAELVKTVRELPKKLETLAPAEAAAAWLAVYDAWLAVPSQTRAENQRLQFSNLVDVLPSPEAWPELVRLIDVRPVEGNETAQLRSLGLRMLGHRLTNQKNLLTQDVERALKLIEPPKKGEGKGGGLASLLGKVFGGSHGQDYWKQNLLRHVTSVKQELDPKSAIEQFRLELESPASEHGGYVTVPDVVRIAGREAAIPLLTKALLLKNVELNFNSRGYHKRTENETIKLARALAKLHLPELTQPHWELCHSIDAVELFEAFAAMPKPKPGGHRFRRDGDEVASLWYVMGLIVRDRPRDVLTFLAKSQEGDNDSPRLQFTSYLVNSILPELERAGHARKVQAFLLEALKSDPELPLWETFVGLSARLGESRQVLTLLEQTLGNPKLSPTTRRNIETVRAEALLAADRVEEGVAESLKLLAAERAEGDEREQQPDRSRMEIALRIAEIGRLLERDEWLRQGTDIAEKLLADDQQQAEIGGLVGLLIEVGQLARAEQLILNKLVKEAARDGDEGGGRSFGMRYGNHSSLEHLVRVYHKAGRAADAVTLLEEAPWWGQSDVRGMLVDDGNLQPGHGERPVVPVPLIAARSLAATDRKDEARRIASALVLKWPSYDAGWQLAMELTGDEFVDLADRAFARDRFEERPLIWLAKFHLAKGNVAKAEELTRQAISIDPSDGEQGRGDRMRAYAVLAEILHKQGDAKTAAVYEGAMKAIRLAERADQFYHAGMLSRGVRMYRESLTHFADAYCIQSRLAVQLAEAGDLEGASRHYQRAFELMPDSFGRVESHCFGCEGVFQGQIAETIAERVFLKLVAEQPKNPRVHYLLGYLRETESRGADAVKSFREAVRLDPEYLNAWQKLLGSAETPDAPLTAEERDEATFQILRLDPAGHHAQADISKVRDVSRLWTTLRDNARRVPEIELSSLFELKASKQQLAEAEGQQRDAGLEAEAIEDIHRQSEHRVEFSSHDILRSIASLIQGAER